MLNPDHIETRTFTRPNVGDVVQAGIRLTHEHSAVPGIDLETELKSRVWCHFYSDLHRKLWELKRATMFALHSDRPVLHSQEAERLFQELEAMLADPFVPR